MYMRKKLRWLKYLINRFSKVNSNYTICVYFFSSRIHVHKICCDDAAADSIRKKRMAKIHWMVNWLRCCYRDFTFCWFCASLIALLAAIASNIFQNPIKTSQYFQIWMFIFYGFAFVVADLYALRLLLLLLLLNRKRNIKLNLFLWIRHNIKFLKNSLRVNRV